MRTMTVLLAVCVLALPGVLLAAAPPQLINYQGVLRNSVDKPLTGSYDMSFHFYDALTGGNEILVDRHMTSGTGPVVVTGGLFNVQIGSGQLADGTGPGTFTMLSQVFAAFSDVYLEVGVGTEVLSPRTHLASAPYAVNGGAGSRELLYSNSGLDSTEDTFVIPAGTFADQDSIAVEGYGTNCTAAAQCYVILNLLVGGGTNSCGKVLGSGSASGGAVASMEIVPSPENSYSARWISPAPFASGGYAFCSSEHWIDQAFSIGFCEGGATGNCVPHTGAWKFSVYRIRGQ